MSACRSYDDILESENQEVEMRKRFTDSEYDKAYDMLKRLNNERIADIESTFLPIILRYYIGHLFLNK